MLRGPAAIAYGGGAIGGVVNVLDGRIPTERNDDLIDGFAYLGAPVSMTAFRLQDASPPTLTD
ncbi:MAG: hypothetical protein JKP95_01110 [Oceanicaulis sp.]|nr:hypothetical protein [Oceanicaulis sp.]